MVRLTEEASGAGEERQRNAGGMRLTGRDLWALRWVGEQYGVRVDQLQRLLGERAEGETRTDGVLTARRTRRVVERWRRAGLVEVRKILHEDPRWVWLTRRGLVTVDLPVKYVELKAGSLAHTFWCGEVRMQLEAEHPNLEWRSDRQLHAFGSDHAERYLPDAEVTIADQVVAVEVELTPKHIRRLTEIVAWHTRDYPETRYYVAQPAMSVLRRALGRLRPEQQAGLTVIELGHVT